MCISGFIIWINSPSSSSSSGGHKDRLLDWTHIKLPVSSSSSKVHGICPGLRASSKPALVVARVQDDGDVQWLQKLSHKYHLCIYDSDAPPDAVSKHLRVPANRGHEAMAYLTFIIDNYHDIPAAGAVFVHGSRFSWHNDHPEYDNADLLASLNVTAAIEPSGYHNMRCDWSAGTCPSDVKPQGSLENKLQSRVSPWELRTVADAAIPAAFAELFGGGKGDNVHLPHDMVLRSQCCAQFVVSQASIWQHSRNEYVALRQWLLSGSAPRDDRISGRILSYIWHILFIQHTSVATEGDFISLSSLNRLGCPDAQQCYCQLYGRCNLECSRPGHCKGQYSIPPRYALPDGWAEQHS